MSYIAGKGQGQALFDSLKAARSSTAKKECALTPLSSASRVRRR